MTKKFSKFKPQRQNANKHTERGLAMLEKSLQKDGWIGAITVAADGETFDGSARLETVGAVMAESEPIIVETDGTRPVILKRTDIKSADDPRAKRLAVAANAIASADWNPDGDLLAILAKEDELIAQMIKNDDKAAEAVKEAAKAGMGEDDAEPQIDRAEELREKWKTERGQLWAIGEHRLLCGDSTSADDVARVMGREVAEILFTSPPYADMREYSGNDLSIETLCEIFNTWSANYFCINLGIQFKNDEVYQYWQEWINRAKKTGLKLLSWNIWDRINATSVSNQLKMFAVNHEFVFIFGNKPKELNRTWKKSEESAKREKYYRVNENGQKVTTRRQADGSVKNSIIGTTYDNKNMGTVFTGYAEMERTIDHPAKFPVDFPSGYIGAMTKENELVAEPFGGSGTTLVACQNLNRKCRAIEISPAYCAVILERMITAFPDIDIHLIDGNEPKAKAKVKK